MKNPVTDTNIERLYNWWIDLLFGWTIWIHKVMAKYMQTYIVVFWLMTYVQYYIPVAIGLNGLGFHWVLGSVWLTAPFLAVPVTAMLSSWSAYIESKRVPWILSRFNTNVGPMFRRRLQKQTKLHKDELKKVLNEVNGVLDKFLERVGSTKISKDEVVGLLKSVIDHHGTQ